MIQCSNIEVSNFDGAIRGMRNPMESWNKSDSYTTMDWDEQKLCNIPKFILGKKDKELAQKLLKAGSSHSKFMRQIFVSMDITAPIYWWKQMDTYKVATTSNSTSTMHKLVSKEFTKEDFSFDSDLNDLKMFFDDDDPEDYSHFDIIIADILYTLNDLKNKYQKTKDKRYWRALIQILPESYNQMRTWTGNYDTLRRIFFERKNHKLDEWFTFCSLITTLPYAPELICIEGEGKCY